MTGQGADWPVPHAELIAYVKEVEAFTGVSGPARYPWDDSRRYAYPPVPRNASAEAMARGARRWASRWRTLRLRSSRATANSRIGDSARPASIAAPVTKAAATPPRPAWTPAISPWPPRMGPRYAPRRA
ncbi:hypothetical protein GCM10020258_40180 [Sphingomonas yabuuchiae]